MRWIIVKDGDSAIHCANYGELGMVDIDRLADLMRLRWLQAKI